jgi:CheY-like chemotaxis protein
VVEDSGIGFPASFQSKLYSPFEQVDSSRTRDYGGTGLGLSIVDKFAKFLGGSINIQSEENKGTRCELRLPLGEVQDEAFSPLPQVIDETVHYKFTGQKILVVEDSIVNQQLMRACLDNYGLEVKIAENGLEGIEQSIRWQPDLVLMDMHMPKMDGLEATGKIRQIETLKDLPIFGLSADVHKTYIQKAFDSGINEYLTKPVDFTLLCRLLNQYLQVEPVPAGSEPSGDANSTNNNKEPMMNEVSVLNVDKGISFAANNSDLFKQLLGTFVSQYEESGQQLQAMKNNAEHDDAMKLAHTMKGVCSTLGMDSLSEVAKKMQFAFANNQLAGIDDDLLRYNELLAIAIREARDYCAT